jgi:hypothetical protein
MTTAYTTRFIAQRPFVPFVMLLANGREHVISHPEFVHVGEYALTVFVLHSSGQVEVIDTALIVSFRTLYASDLNSWRSQDAS